MNRNAWIILIAAIVLLLGIGINCSQGNTSREKIEEKSTDGGQSQFSDSDEIARLRGVELLLALKTPDSLEYGIPHLPNDAPGIDLTDINGSSEALQQDKEIGKKTYTPDELHRIKEWHSPDYFTEVPGLSVHLPDYNQEFWVAKRIKELGYEDFEQACYAVLAELELIDSIVPLSRELDIDMPQTKNSDGTILIESLTPEEGMCAFSRAWLALHEFYIYGKAIPADFPFSQNDNGDE